MTTNFTPTLFRPGLAKARADDGATAYAPGQRDQILQRNWYDRDWPDQSHRDSGFGYDHPDPQVTDLRGAAARDLASRGGCGITDVPVSASRLHSGTAPGEPVLEVVTPALVKARHPTTGRYTETEIAQGHPSLEQQPKPLSGTRDPFRTQLSEPGVRSDPNARSMLGSIPQPSSIPLTVPVSRLDLAGAAGLPGGLVREPEPAPVSRPSPTLDPQACRTSAASPLAAAVAAHNSSPAAFGLPPTSRTMRAPGE